MGNPGDVFCPSNGTEGEIFQEQYCNHCARDAGAEVLRDVKSLLVLFYMKLGKKNILQNGYTDLKASRCAQPSPQNLLKLRHQGRS